MWLCCWSADADDDDTGTTDPIPSLLPHLRRTTGLRKNTPGHPPAPPPPRPATHDPARSRGCSSPPTPHVSPGRSTARTGPLGRAGQSSAGHSHPGPSHSRSTRPAWLDCRPRAPRCWRSHRLHSSPSALSRGPGARGLRTPAIATTLSQGPASRAPSPTPTRHRLRRSVPSLGGRLVPHNVALSGRVALHGRSSSRQRGNGPPAPSRSPAPPATLMSFDQHDFALQACR